MTARSLATKLRRLENLVKRRPGWNDAAASFPPVVLPLAEEFRVLPAEEQKRLLSAWRPSRCAVDLPPLEEFEMLPVQERIRLMEESMGPTDPNVSACFSCLPLSEQVNMLRGDNG
jgi:hypothetical protein